VPISNVRDVSAGKGFSNSALNNRSNSEQGGDAFSVSGAPKQEQLQAVNEKNAGNNAQTTMGQKDLIPLAVTSSKNQTLAVETVKDIIDTGLLATAKMNGYTELVGELEQLSASLYIPARDLLKEIGEQEKQNTMFSGDKFYDLLRELAKEADGDQKEAIGNMLKAINFSQNRSEITTAVSANLKFLAEYFSPNRGLSGKLADLAEQWSSPDSQQNFAALRDQTSELLQNLSDSLLNDSHTQTLLPIVTHNLSKFNTNTSMIRENFNQLLTLIPNYEQRNELSRAFEGLLNKLINKDPDLIPRSLRDDIAEDSAAAVPQEFAMQGQEQAVEGQKNTPQNIPLDNYTTNEQKNQGENEILGNEYQSDNTISAYLTNTLGNNDYVSQSGLLETDLTPFMEDLRSGSATPEETIKDILTSLIENEDVRNALDRQLSSIHSSGEMINFLNEILEAMPNNELTNKVYEALEEAVGQMPDLPDNTEDRVRDDEERRHQGGGQQSMNDQGSRQMKEKSSSIQALTDFVEKNINHPALKSIDSFNASNLLQSMINAPGVLTPLAHYILPIQIENTRAFGELWVDNNDESGATGKGGGNHYHLFLTFDVDTYGRFEVDVYANDNSVRVSMLHPPTFARNAENIVQRVTRIAAGTKYRIDDFQTGVLKEPHSLTQIFPKLTERRAGLNVKA